MAKLSVYLITRNEERDLPACLESVRACADEIVMVDDESDDTTVEVGRRYGARVIVRKMSGFGEQKQFALDQTTGDWALSIDADERLTPELAREIRERIADPGPHVAFSIKRHFFFLGRRLRFGGVGSDWSLRLLQRGRGRFRQVAIHEGIEVDGPCSRLRHPLEHYSYSDLEEYLTKRSLYTQLSGDQAYRRGRRFSRFDHLRPSWELFVRVVLRGAWLDGQPGLIYAGLSADTAWLRAIRLWEITEQERHGGSSTPGEREPDHDTRPGSDPTRTSPGGPRNEAGDPRTAGRTTSPDERR